MREKRALLLLVFSAVLVFTVLLSIAGPWKNNELKCFFTADESSGSRIYIEEYDLYIKGTDRDGCTYFLLPAFLSISRIDQSLSDYKLLSYDGTVITEIPSGEEEILVDAGNGDPVPWRIAFLRSENLCSVFVETNDTDMDDLQKDRYDKAEVSVYTPDGYRMVDELPVLLKLRGNTTADGMKKPYEIKLEQDIPMCGMKSSNKWALLANAFEETKIYNKMAFDLSDRIGMEYSIESDWVDLYADGQYLGNYLLCREPNIGKHDLDIGSLETLNSAFWDPEKVFETEDMKGYVYDHPVNPLAGGYLFERVADEYYDEKKCGFRVAENSFALKSPDNASEEQLDYICSYTRQVNDTLEKGAEDQLDVVDSYSFARRFLIEELLYNFDAFRNSYYFYKKPGTDKLCAGPVWDYDNSLGSYGGDDYLNYRNSIFDSILTEDDDNYHLKWDSLLYENDEYRSYLISVFKENIPVFRELIEKDIDAYFKRIEASANMDLIVWGKDKSISPYRDRKNDIRFAKFFLSKRLEWLCERWGVDEEFSYDFSDGSDHTITFVFPDGSVSDMTVRDGEQVSPDTLPEYDTENDIGWCYEGAARPPFDKPFSYYIPVYEDMTLEPGLPEED